MKRWGVGFILAAVVSFCLASYLRVPVSEHLFTSRTVAVGDEAVRAWRQAKSPELKRLSGSEAATQIVGVVISRDGGTAGDGSSQEVFHANGRYQVFVTEPFIGSIDGTYSAEGDQLCIKVYDSKQCFWLLTDGHGSLYQQRSDYQAIPKLIRSRR